MVAVIVVPPGFHLARVAYRLNREQTYDPRALPSSVVDDASRLNRTEVRRVWQAPADRDEAERQLSEILKQAATDGTRIAIAGARHSMGGQTQLPDAVVLDMNGLDYLELDAQKKILRAGAGARWSAVIPLLDRRGLSVSVMQSNDDFQSGDHLEPTAMAGSPAVLPSHRRFAR